MCQEYLDNITKQVMIIKEISYVFLLLTKKVITAAGPSWKDPSDL